MKGTVALLLCLLPGVAMAQLTVPDVVAPYEPIVIGCNCIIPEGGEADFHWTVDSKSKYVGVPADKPTKLHVWAPPGPHSVEALVIVKTFQSFTILVNKDTGETREVRLPVNFDIQRYSKSYTVGDKPLPPDNPDNPDNPDPPPPPPITDPFAKEVQNWLAAVPNEIYAHSLALAIADNYQAVASEAVATQTMYDILAFVAKTKEKNQQTLGANIARWVPPFFQPLAVYQDKLAKERGIDIYRDEAGLAKLWRETADAIRKAAK
jgi:hypothetical protein